MLIVDTQVHIWKNRSGGSHPAHHSQRESFTKDELLAEMAVAGVQRAVIAPSSSIPKDHSYEAVREHPQQFAIMDGIALDEARGDPFHFKRGGGRAAGVNGHCYSPL